MSRHNYYSCVPVRIPGKSLRNICNFLIGVGGVRLTRLFTFVLGLLEFSYLHSNSPGVDNPHKRRMKYQNRLKDIQATTSLQVSLKSSIAPTLDTNICYPDFA